MVRDALVSVIVPVCNVEKHLKECLNSLINQTYNNIEIICINDGSVDNSLKILQEYEQKYPDKFIILTQENQGLSAARNAGINVMKGEFCLFVDSDDYISPITIELCIKKMIYFESDGIYFKGIHFAENRILDYMYAPYIKFIDSQELNVYDPFLSHVTNAVLIFYRTSIIKKYNLRFIDRLFCEDWPFVMSYLSKVKTVYWLNAALYYYRMNNTSLSNTMSDWHLGMFKAVEERKKPLETANLWRFHEQLQNLLGLRYILNFYHSKVYIMSSSQRKQWQHEIKNMYLSHTPVYRIWLWTMLEKSKILKYIVQDKNLALNNLLFLKKIGLENTVDRLFMMLRKIMQVPLIFLRIISDFLKLIVKIILRIFKKVPFDILFYLNRIRYNMGIILNMPVFLYRCFVYLVKIIFNITIYFLKILQRNIKNRLFGMK